MSPPFGVLKLNFDSSFLRSIGEGGIGGVIRNWDGIVIRSFSGPMDSLDANGAEVFALLVGCRELLKLGGYNLFSKGILSRLFNGVRGSLLFLGD